MKRIKRTFTQDEKNLVFDLWKQGAGIRDIGRVIEAKPGLVFTILRETGDIKPRQRSRNVTHLTIEERQEIRVALSAKKSIRSIAKDVNRAPLTISREVIRHRGRRYYKAVDADRRATMFAKSPKDCPLEKNMEFKYWCSKNLN
jgi:hypothetical protein